MGIVISSPTWDYEMEHYLGSGAYGAVVQSKKLGTNETVALKVIKNERYMDIAKKEVEILQYLKGLGSDKFNIIMLNDSFTHVGCYYMEFEKLDINLTDFLRKKPQRSLEQKDICPIVHQLATALDFLHSVGIVHADLKPENIMIVDEVQKPVTVKIIDFGLALKNPEEHRGEVLQTLWYRCPEVLLGAPFSGAIDVWSLGCIVVEMFTGSALFPGEDENEMMNHIVLSFGNPPEYLLNSGLNTMQFFNKNDGEEEPCGQWTLRRGTEIGNINFIPHRTLDFLNMLRENVSDENASESERDSFVKLVADMLKVDSAKRISPNEILLHPFVAKSCLADKSIHGKSSSSAGSKTKIDHNDDSEPANSSDQRAKLVLPHHLSTSGRGGYDEEASESDKASPDKKRKRGCLSNFGGKKLFLSSVVTLPPSDGHLSKKQTLFQLAPIVTQTFDKSLELCVWLLPVSNDPIILMPKKAAIRPFALIRK